MKGQFELYYETCFKKGKKLGVRHSHIYSFWPWLFLLLDMPLLPSMSEVHPHTSQSPLLTCQEKLNTHTPARGKQDTNVPGISEPLSFLFSPLYLLLSDKLYHSITVFCLPLQNTSPLQMRLGFLCFIS